MPFTVSFFNPVLLGPSIEGPTTKIRNQISASQTELHVAQMELQSTWCGSNFLLIIGQVTTLITSSQHLFAPDLASKFQPIPYMAYKALCCVVGPLNQTTTYNLDKKGCSLQGNFMRPN
jgi:hypothetical protein